MVDNFLDSQRAYQFMAVVMDNICRGQKIGLAATILPSIRRRFWSLDSKEFYLNPDGPANHAGSNISALYKITTKKPQG
jgi:hypothetical protein